MRVFSVPLSAPLLRTVIAALIDGRLVAGFEARAHPERLAAAWARSPVSAPLVVGGPASTLALAGDLARLIDDMVTRGVGWEALDGLVPDRLDKYWQHSLEFLRIAQRNWPAHLKEIGKLE